MEGDAYRTMASFQLMRDCLSWQSLRGTFPHILPADFDWSCDSIYISQGELWSMNMHHLLVPLASPNLPNLFSFTSDSI